MILNKILKIMIIEDNVLFLRQLIRSLSAYSVTDYSSIGNFLDKYRLTPEILKNEINNTDFFLLDFWLSKDETIFSSGIFEIIHNNKNTNAKLISISSLKEHEVLEYINEGGLNPEFKFDGFIEKKTDSICKYLK